MRWSPGLRFQIVAVLVGAASVGGAVAVGGAAPVFGALAEANAPGEAAPLSVVGEGAPPRPLGRRLVWALLAASLVTVLLAALGLFRAVVRPVERMAERVDALTRLEFSPEESAHQLGQLGTSFHAMVFSLSQERERTLAQIEALEQSNAALEAAREELIRAEKLATVGRLAAGVAHEIGNPLGGLVGYLGLLSGRADGDSRLQPLIDGALQSAERIDATIRELLDFARPAEASAAPFPLSLALDEAQRLVQPQLPALRRAGPGPALEVLADRGRVVQVLVNLLLNARDAVAGEGEVGLRVRAEGEVWVEVEIWDRGPGLPEGVDVFEPFVTTKAPGEGTGLGLAISHRLVEGWGGQLRARTLPEGGASFSLTLPRALAPA